MSPTRAKGMAQSAELKRRNLLTALVITAIAAAICVSMFAYRFSHHLSPMPETGGYSSPYLPTR